MKRWFISLVCLVLVFSMVAPFPALAASNPSISFAPYETGSTDYGTYTLTTYTVSDHHASRVQYGTSEKNANYTDFYSRTVTFDYSTHEAYNGYRSMLKFNIGFADNSGVLYHTTNFDGFLISGTFDVEYFKLATFSFPICVTSTVSTSVQFVPCLDFVTSNYRISTVTGDTSNVSVSANTTYTYSGSVSFSNVPSNAVAVVPYVRVTFTSTPTSGSVTIDSYSFTTTVKAGTGIPDFPVFSKNLGGTLTYLKNSESDALTVSASVEDGGAVTYAWYETDVPSSSGGKHVKSGDTFYPPTYWSGTLYYYCVATNTLSNGQTSSTTSGLVTINVIGPPESPQITQDLGAGTLEYEQGESPLALIVQAIAIDGGDLTYQWYENNADSTEGGSMIEGATSSRYLPSTSVIGIKYYYCVVTNTISGYTAETTSSVAAVRVVSPPDPAVQPVITSDLSTEEVIYMTGSAAAALRIGAEAPDGGTLAYQWYSMSDSPASGVTGVAIPGANTASFTPETVVAGTTYYYCIVTNKLNDTTAQVRSRVAMITVEDPPPETTPPQLDEMNDKLDDTNNFLDNIVNGILNLPQAILDGIKGLFVPDAETMAAYQDQWSELLKTRFGAIYESVDVVGNFVESLNTGSKQETISLPSVTVDLAGTPWTFGGWSVDVVPDGFEFLTTYSRLIVNIIATFAFINGLRNKFEGVLGGGS